ncbi:hypothetical protein [Phenylobacterium sp.]|uniref:hypothetical protein n=1 Tax=Phenylobacterium sp. TaxID=1871053 RepID=UPI00391A974C
MIADFLRDLAAREPAELRSAFAELRAWFGGGCEILSTNTNTPGGASPAPRTGVAAPELPSIAPGRRSLSSLARGQNAPRSRPDAGLSGEGR